MLLALDDDTGRPLSLPEEILDYDFAGAILSKNRPVCCINRLTLKIWRLLSRYSTNARLLSLREGFLQKVVPFSKSGDLKFGPREF